MVEFSGAPIFVHFVDWPRRWFVLACSCSPLTNAAPLSAGLVALLGARRVTFRRAAAPAERGRRQLGQPTLEAEPGAPRMNCYDERAGLPAPFQVRYLVSRRSTPQGVFDSKLCQFCVSATSGNGMIERTVKPLDFEPELSSVLGGMI